MTDTRNAPPHLRLIFFTGALRELDQLAETQGEIEDETGLEPPGHLEYYLGARRAWIAANIARLREEIDQQKIKAPH